MAVVQISRIQIRRGRKNQGSGLPQLASGEFGWAVDAQELYIGNGSVAEGAPYVGNTKILSEHDNIFEFATNYSYKSDSGLITTGPNDTSINRSLQERLDDRVSVRAFGAEGNGGNQTAALQRAIDQLFLNDATVANPQSRVILNIEPGTYNITSTIYLPPYVTIRGAGKQKTIINFTGTGQAFKTVRGTGSGNIFTSEDYTDAGLLAANTTLTQARNIYLSDFTLNVTSGSMGLVLDSCRDSIFENIEIIGTRELGDGADYVGQIPDEIGIQLNSLSSVVTCKNNIFRNISIQSLYVAIYSDYDINNNTWENCNFETLYEGIKFGAESVIGTVGQITGPVSNTVKNSVFKDIERQGFYIENGTGNNSIENEYYLVGNDAGTDATPATPVVEFIDVENHSIDDWFERTAALGNNPTYIDTTHYVPEVSSQTIYDSSYTYRLVPFSSPSTFEKFFKLPADRARSFEIEYLYKSTTATRNGIMRVSVDPVNDLITFSDEYEVIGTNADNSDELIFQAQGYSLSPTPTNPIDTVAVMMLNSTGDVNASFYYRVKTLT